MVVPEYDGYIFNNLNGEYVRHFEGVFSGTNIAKSYYGLFRMNSSLTINMPLKLVQINPLMQYLDSLDLDSAKEPQFRDGEIYLPFLFNRSMYVRDDILSVSKTALLLENVDLAASELTDWVRVLAPTYYQNQMNK